MANPFYVQPASGLPGYQAVREGMSSGAEARLEASRQNKQQALLEEGAQIIQTGTPEEISAFAMKNPSLIEAIDKSIGFRSDITKQSLITSAKRTLIEGVQPSVALADHADTILNEGGDASQTLALAQQAQQNPQSAIDEAEKVLALYDSDALKAYRSHQGKAVSGKPIPKQKTGAFLVRNRETGDTSIAVGSYDTETGELTTETAGFSGLDVVSKLGETAREQTERKVEESGLSQEATDKARRYSDLVSRGTSAAEGMATYKRGIELLKKIKTGGVSAVALAAKRFFGVSGADEGELSNSLAKAVLSQYRETFGAAFTENEGKKLDRIEASFGKSPEANSRLLAQGLKMSERTANRAIKAAERREDYETVDDIRDLLEFTLSTEAPTQPAPAQQQVQPAPVQSIAQQQQQYREGQTATGPGGQKLIFSNGNWGPI